MFGGRVGRFVLVTGAGGFVGRALVPALVAEGWNVRQVSQYGRPGAFAIGEINGLTDWTDALENCDAVVHLAARVHDDRRGAADDYRNFRRTNCEATLRLAEQAVERGVGRFVFVSTVKVNGEGREAAYTSSDAPAPQGAYAVSKLEAEQGLWQIAARTGLEVVILRPPLIYGPGVGGNFRTLLRIVATGLPLPLASIRNRRSFLGSANFVSAIRVALTHQGAPGRTWLVSDQQDLSTPDMVRAIGVAYGKRPLLLPARPAFLRTIATLVGRQRAYDQLVNSLTVDSSPLVRELGWTPPLTVGEQLAAMV